jgi:hypothetical protein
MEAEGRAEALPGTLRQMGQHVFGQGSPPALDPARSHGYVRWLKQAYVDGASALTNGMEG